MRQRVAGRDYEILFGGDVAADGFFAELWDVSDSHSQILVLALRSDVDGKTTISAYLKDLPLELVEQFLVIAKRRRLPALSPERPTQP